MSLEQVLLAVTATVALLALIIALLAIRTLARVRAQNERPRVSTRTDLAPPPVAPEPIEQVRTEEKRDIEIRDDRVVVRPTSAQIVTTTMHHPLVRLNVVLVGLSHALRPESRDRLRSLVRREFRARKAVRRKAARRAARGVSESNSSAPLWVSAESLPRELPERPFDVSRVPRREIES